jgi:L-arabinose isomerase
MDFDRGCSSTVFSKALTTEFIEDFAEMAGVELVVIDNKTEIRDFKEKLRRNEVYFHLFQNNL